MNPTQVWLFLGAAIALVAIPGPGVLYVVARSVDQGRRAGLVSVLGVGIGNFAQVVLAALGLSALITSSALAFDVIRIAPVLVTSPPLTATSPVSVKSVMDPAAGAVPPSAGGDANAVVRLLDGNCPVT